MNKLSITDYSTCEKEIKYKINFIAYSLFLKLKIYS